MNNSTNHAKQPMTDKGGEVRELTAADMAGFQPINEVLPELANILPKRGKQKAPTKQRVTIRLSPDVVEHFQADGQGWQTRLDDALKRHIAKQDGAA